MAINPLRVMTNFDVPVYPAPMVRPDPSTWANLASIGDAIGAYREQSAVADLIKNSLNDKGELDLQKAATNIALSGRNPQMYLNALVQRQSLSRSEAAQKALEEHYREMERQGREQLDRPDIHFIAPSLLNPGGFYTIPRKPGASPSYAPLPPPAPGPTSAVPGSDATAFDPENAPPYQVAGPPMPPPRPTGTVDIGKPEVVPAAPAPTPTPAPTPPAAEAPARNDKFLQSLPENARPIVKGIAEYKIDPDKYTGKDREDLIGAAMKYRPDYDMTQFQKRGSPPSGEIAARVGLGNAFLERVPGIRDRLKADELNTIEGRGMALMGQGGPGELRRAIDEGAEALLRGLTGAGMSQNEANNYARRYGFSVADSKQTQIRKLNELENAIRHVNAAIMEGRGGSDVMKGFESQFGKSAEDIGAAPKKAPRPKVKNDAEANKLIGQARAAFARDPTARDEIISIMRESGIENPEAYLGR